MSLPPKVYLNKGATTGGKKKKQEKRKSFWRQNLQCPRGASSQKGWKKKETEQCT